MEIIANAILKVLKNINDTKIISEVKKEMLKLCNDFPIYEKLEY
jgi:glycine hydroxymethyltransferase